MKVIIVYLHLLFTLHNEHIVLTTHNNQLTLYPADIFLAVGAYSTPTRWLEGQILRTNFSCVLLARTSNKPSSSVYEFALILLKVITL